MFGELGKIVVGYVNDNGCMERIYSYACKEIGHWGYAWRILACSLRSQGSTLFIGILVEGSKILKVPQEPVIPILCKGKVSLPYCLLFSLCCCSFSSQ